MPQRNYVDEIEGIRDRTGPSEWDNGITKLFFLAQNTAKLAGEGEKVCYYPVAAIAALEVYFKWEIRHLLDSNDLRFVDNVELKSFNLPIDHRLLRALHGRRITLGELIAHSARLSSFDSVCRTMGQLLGADFLALVKDARDPHDRREKGTDAPMTIGDADKVIADVKRAYDVRNIICHEAHLELPTTVSEVVQLCAACYRFALASRNAIAYLCNPNQPLTLADALERTLERIAILERLVKDAEAELAKTMPPLERDAFEKTETAWRLYVEAQEELAVSFHMNGSRGVLDGKFLVEEKVRERLGELEKMKKARAMIFKSPADPPDGAGAKD